METSRKLGFGGCVGSLDCTHVKWSRCPDDIRFDCLGKEGYPSLSFQVIVTHPRYCYHVSNAFFGATNDQTIMRNDPQVHKIISQLYSDIRFIIYDKDGVPFLSNNPFFWCDNGYPKYLWLIRPYKDGQSIQSILWSEYCEFVRKDVECFFGILKNLLYSFDY